MKKYQTTFFLCLTLLFGLGAVLAVPWNGLSYFQLWRDVRSGNVVYSGDTSRKSVALTFDDGPDPRYTPQVLNILKKRHIKATFFVCGDMVKKHPELLKRIVREGHAIGNHTDTHPHLETRTLVEVGKEIDDCQTEILKVTGVKSNLFRCPRGFLNGKIVHSAIVRGYKVIQWSLAFDRSAIKDSRKLRNRVVDAARPGDFILMHDGSNTSSIQRTPTIRELDSLVLGLSNRGFTFDTVPGLLETKMAHQTSGLQNGANSSKM